jgi:hypothetical protein
MTPWAGYVAGRFAAAGGVGNLKNLVIENSRVYGF